MATVSDSDYAGSATGTMTITPLTPAVRLSSSSNPAVAQTGVTFTASVSSTVGTPTGTVSFLDGTTPLGQGTLTAGVATLTTSSLTDGSHSITAVYNGDTNFVAVTSAALSQSILDFSLTPGSGSGSGSGSSRHYPNSRARRVGYLSAEHRTNCRHHLPNPGPVNGYRHAGGCDGSHHSVFVGSDSPVTRGLSRQTPQLNSHHVDHPGAARFDRDEQRVSGLREASAHRMGSAAVAFAVRMRSAGKRLRGIILTLLLTAAGLGTVSTLSGCVTGNGFFGQQRSSYTVTVTATSGPLTRSTNLTLNVE